MCASVLVVVPLTSCKILYSECAWVSSLAVCSSRVTDSLLCRIILVKSEYSFRVLFVRFGCPAMEDIESYSHEYKKRLDEAGSLGKVPDNLALEVIRFLFSPLSCLSFFCLFFE